MTTYSKSGWRFRLQTASPHLLSSPPRPPQITVKEHLAAVWIKLAAGVVSTSGLTPTDGVSCNTLPLRCQEPGVQDKLRHRRPSWLRRDEPAATLVAAQQQQQENDRRRMELRYIQSHCIYMKQKLLLYSCFIRHRRTLKMDSLKQHPGVIKSLFIYDLISSPV